MTLFSRKGHYRTSSLGTLYWVGKHDVSRDDWYRSQRDSELEYTEYQESLRRLQEIGADASAASAYTNSNASCPVCGQSVFFYRWGSRVYFDDLGKPWPKHPCTDLPGDGRSSQAPSYETVLPDFRIKAEVQTIEKLLDLSWRDTRREFGEKYGEGHWNAFKVVKRLSVKKRTLLVLDGVSYSAPQRIFLAGEKVPRGIRENLLIYYYRNWVSFFDLETMQPVDHELKRLPGLSAFVEALIGAK